MLAKTHLTSKQIEKAIRLYRGGKTQNEIAELVGVHGSTISRQLRASGIKIRRGLSFKQVEKIIQYYRSGKSQREIAKLTGSDSKTISRYLKAAGVEFRTWFKTPPKIQLEIIRQYRDGRMITEIAREFGLCNQTVSGILKQGGESPKEVGQGVKTSFKIRQKIIRQHHLGQSPVKIGEIFGLSAGGIRGILRQEGESIRERGHYTRRYFIDNAFFDNITTESQAYWLGFITADGHVERCRCLSINLNTRDRDHLEKLGLTLKMPEPVPLRKLKMMRIDLLSIPKNW